MMFKQLALATVSTAFAAAFATQAAAQAGGPLTISGAVPAGVCSFNGNRAVAESTAGKYVAGRLQELTTQVKAELDAQQTSLQTDAQALDGQKATLAQATYQSRAEALQQRYASFQRTEQIRQREMQDTQTKAVQTIEVQLGPIVQQTATARHCTLLISAEALVLPNPSIDITDAAMATLNTKLTSFAVEREHLDQQPGAR
jgi:Skp family chaperone for outer membrane proteins